MKMNREILALAGLTAIVIGCFRVHVIFGWIVLGLVLCGMSLSLKGPTP